MYFSFTCMLSIKIINFPLNSLSHHGVPWSHIIMILVCCGSAWDIQPVYTHRTLSHGIFYPLLSGCWWSGSPTNTMFILDVKLWVMVKKVGKESTLFCLDSFKSHSTLNISFAKQLNYWPSPGNQQPHDMFILRALLNVTWQKPLQEMVVSGCSVAVWRSVNSLPGCVYTGHSNRKDPKTHGNH